MANNGIVNSLTFIGSVAEQVTIQSAPIGGNLIFQLPGLLPIANQLMAVQSVSGNVVSLAWANPTSGGGGGAVSSVFGRTGAVQGAETTI